MKAIQAGNNANYDLLRDHLRQTAKYFSTFNNINDIIDRLTDSKKDILTEALKTQLPKN